MEKITSIEDEMRGRETYALEDGRRICFDALYLRKVGLTEALRREGLEPPKGRVPVYQDGSLIGTVPATFDPFRIKSTSFFYEPRPGDFTRQGDKWVADKMMGPGDFDCVPGFVWKR